MEFYCLRHGLRIRVHWDKVDRYSRMIWWTDCHGDEDSDLRIELKECYRASVQAVSDERRPVPHESS